MLLLNSVRTCTHTVFIYTPVCHSMWYIRVYKTSYSYQACGSREHVFRDLAGILYGHTPQGWSQLSAGYTLHFPYTLHLPCNVALGLVDSRD